MQARRHTEQRQQRLSEAAEQDHHRDAEQQPEDQAGTEDVAGFGQPAAAICARGKDEHTGEAGKADDDRDEGEDPARRQRRELIRAIMADDRDIDHVHQRPVEAGQHDRPGERQDAPRFG